MVVNNSGLIDFVEYNNYVDEFMLDLLSDGVVIVLTTGGLYRYKKSYTQKNQKRNEVKLWQQHQTF